MPSSLRILRARFSYFFNEDINTNCIGTALFLSGWRDSDSYVTQQAANDVLRGLPTIRSPMEDAILAFFDDAGNVRHAAVVESTHPLTFVHRTDANGPIERGCDLSVIAAEYAGMSATYYRPRFTQD